jgi:hypothetical protein
MSYCVFIIRRFKEGSCLIVFLLLDSLRRAHVLLCFIIRQFKEGSCLIVFLLFDSLRRAHVLLCFYYSTA